MFDDEKGIVLIVVFFIGAIIGSCASNTWWQIKAIKAGKAEFYFVSPTQQEGKWRWKP